MIDLVEVLDKQPPDWTIESLPLKHDRGEVSGVSALVRSDNAETISLVHRGFSPIQNREGIEFAESLGYKFQGSRVSHRGRRVFLVFSVQTLEMAGEEVSLFLCLTNAHGTALTTVSLEAPDREAFLTPHLIFRRQACLNVFDSLWFNRGRSLRIIPSKADGAETLESWINENIDGSLGKAKKLLATRVSSTDVRRYAHHFPRRDGEPTLFDLWSTSPDLEPVRETGWGAYQAVAAYLTHHYLHKDPDWWLIEDNFAFHYLSEAGFHFEAQAKNIPFHAWNRETGSYERKR